MLASLTISDKETKILGGDMKAQFTRVFSFILIVVMLASLAPSILSQSGNGTSVSLSVPYYFQGNTGWCLPTSMSMIYQYFGINIKSWEIARDWRWSRDVSFWEDLFGAKSSEYNVKNIKCGL